MLNKSFLNTVVNNFLEHVFVLNVNGEIVFQTENNSSLLGYTHQEIIEKGFPQLYIASEFSFDEI